MATTAASKVVWAAWQEEQHDFWSSLFMAMGRKFKHTCICVCVGAVERFSLKGMYL